MTEIQKRKAHSIEAGKTDPNGTKYYLVRWEGQNDPKQFTWVPETEFDPNSEIVTRFLTSNIAEFTDKATQTKDTVWIFPQIPKVEEYDYFKSYVSNPNSNKSSNDNDLLPIKVINYDPTNNTFQTSFADKAEPKWIESEILLSIAPELIAKYFIICEKSKKH
ncbi:hypothetical protein M9Y10_015100 [Tritrichomonas musculus]|uniref:Chromo domain-containing protein n=1 Tax=Tritrichomonas musculus TaxID=1915356 RepID=A0ABR2L2E8_9EUKA